MKHTINLSENKLYSGKRNFLTYLRSILAFLVISLLTILNVDAQQTDTAKAQTQEKLLTGVVLDHENLPLPGLSIVLKGTKIGASTDFEGKYTFPKKLKEGDVLVFSFLGYTPKKIKIGKDQTVLNVTMDAELVELMGAVSDNQVYKSKRTLWQKIKGIF